jgi:glycosyltransferase involved in cell wall biosynthesis
MKNRIVFVQPVLAPYWIPRFESLAALNTLDIHIVLESESFPERAGWTPRPVQGCTVHLTQSKLYQKTIQNKRLGYTECFTQAIPYGLPLLLYELKPDAVLLCNATQVLMALLARSMRKFKLGILLEDTPQAQEKKHVLVQSLRRTVYRRADFFFALSRDVEDYAASLGLAGRRYTSSWSVESSWLSLPRKESSIFPLKFLYVGQLIERKGIMPMLRAWKRFSSCNRHVELQLVGDGPLRGQVQSYCAGNELTNVYMAGSVPYSTVRDYYLSSDIFILPTMEDIYGMVMTEAMAFGLPVITTVYCGGRELVREGFNGYVCDSADIHSIAVAMEKAYTDLSRLPEMGANARDVMSQFTHEEVMSRMGADLLDVLAQ